MGELLAYEVEVNAMRCIVFAENAPAARMSAVLGYWDAGFGRGPGHWPPGVHAGRVPLFDKSPLRKHGKNRGWDPEVVAHSV